MFTVITQHQKFNSLCRTKGLFQKHSKNVVRVTHPTLVVLLDSRIDDDWNVDGDRKLSMPWTALTQLTMLNDDGYSWSGERLTKVQGRFGTAGSLVKYPEKFSTKR